MKRKTIRNHRDFLTPLDAPTVVNRVFIAKAKPAVRKDARYGIIAAKKTFKLAVQRNRAKRVLRDWIAYNEDLMSPNLDYIFVARCMVLDFPRDRGRKKMAHAIKKISE